MTVKFVWSEFCVLLYECCLSPLMVSSLQSLFQSLLNFALLSETDAKMGELLRVLLPVICLYQEGRKMDEKPIRNAQKVLLTCLTTSRLCSYSASDHQLTWSSWWSSEHSKQSHAATIKSQWEGEEAGECMDHTLLTMQHCQYSFMLCESCPKSLNILLHHGLTSTNLSSRHWKWECGKIGRKSG